MVMLHALCLAQVGPLHVITVDHQLRPDARADAEWVVRVARSWGCPAELIAVTCDVAGDGVEGAARHARYAALLRRGAELGASVATGHTADDQAETLLMRLSTGVGVHGARGILRRRPGVVRPMLMVTRSEIAEHAERFGVPWREDPTNTSDKFLRNRVRHGALEGLDVALGPHWRAGTARAASRLQSDCEALDYLLSGWLEESTRPESPLALSRTALLKAPEGLRRLALRHLWAEAISAPMPRGGGKHLDLALMRLHHTGQWQLPGGWLLRHSRDWVEIVADPSR